MTTGQMEAGQHKRMDQSRQFSGLKRKETLEAMAQQQFDVIVIGGGLPARVLRWTRRVAGFARR
jgi:hypothetical protein